MGIALGELATDLQRAGDEAVSREARLTLLASRFETVARVARETSASLSARYVSETVTSAAADLLGTRTTLWVRTDEGHFLATRRSDDPHGVVPPSSLSAPAVVANAAADARPADHGPARAYPLLLAGMVIGVLEAAEPQYDEDVEHVLDALLSTAAAALEAARLHSSFRELAHVDALTQLPNRRRLESDIETEWERSHRYKRPLSFVMLDLDHFKQLNDTYGHLVGDTVLHQAAAAIATVLRSSDTAYRYGGEEFGVLLRETGPDEARAVAERLRKAVAGVMLPETTARVTASVGVASASDAMVEHLELVADADAALYEAKRSGRNRVVVAPPLATRSHQRLSPRSRRPCGRRRRRDRCRAIPGVPTPTTSRHPSSPRPHPTDVVPFRGSPPPQRHDIRPAPPLSGRTRPGPRAAAPAGGPRTGPARRALPARSPRRPRSARPAGGRAYW